MSKIIIEHGTISYVNESRPLSAKDISVAINSLKEYLTKLHLSDTICIKELMDARNNKILDCAKKHYILFDSCEDIVGVIFSVEEDRYKLLYGKTSSCMLFPSTMAKAIVKSLNEQ